MCEFRSAALSDLSEVVYWIGSAQQARNWAGPQLTYPIDNKRLRQQVQWAQTLSFCLEDGGRAIGFGQIVPKAANRLHLARLIVRPVYRGNGHGRTLALRLVDQALARAPSALFLNVFADNTAAVELYRRIGFAVAARESDDAQLPAHYRVYRA